MNFAVLEVAAGRPASSSSITGDRAASIEGSSFAAAMAAANVEFALPIGSAGPSGSAEMAARAMVLASGSSQSESALGALARRLDEVGRHRLEAQTLSADLAGAWATGADAPTLAVSMHRQAHAMASYNLNVMWGAKLVGVTAGALRQLVSAT